MRRLKLIGIGAGNPDHLTIQAVKALQQVDVVLLTDKGQDTADLVQARRNICESHLRAKPYRTIEILDPQRDRAAGDYRAAVADWHDKRAAVYERVLSEQLSANECGAFLVWGDPSLYDSTLRIIDQVATRGRVQFECEVIPGISSVQVLAARHRISLNEIGEPIHITTGRRLSEESLPPGASVVVMLDGDCTFKTLTDDDIDIYWGAYLGTPDEILIAGRLPDVGPQIEQARAQARRDKGWIMDTYLLRRRRPPR
jgi:precorrin-6A synthase